MGYILKELEKDGPVSGEKWQSLANSIVRQASAGQGAEILENVSASARREGWSEIERLHLEETYQSRGLSDLGAWYQYMNAKDRRLDKREALETFNVFLEQIDRLRGQLHPVSK